MGVFVAKPGTEKQSATSIQKVSIPDTEDVSPEKKTAQRDAFWAGALESASILVWIVTHLPSPEQYPFL